MIFDPKNQGMILRLNAIKDRGAEARNRASINTGTKCKRTCRRADSRRQGSSWRSHCAFSYICSLSECA